MRQRVHSREVEEEIREKKAMEIKEGVNQVESNMLAAQIREQPPVGLM